MTRNHLGAFLVSPARRDGRLGAVGVRQTAPAPAAASSAAAPASGSSATAPAPGSSGAAASFDAAGEGSKAGGGSGAASIAAPPVRAERAPRRASRSSRPSTSYPRRPRTTRRARASTAARSADRALPLRGPAPPRARGVGSRNQDRAPGPRDGPQRSHRPDRSASSCATAARTPIQRATPDAMFRLAALYEERGRDKDTNLADGLEPAIQPLPPDHPRVPEVRGGRGGPLLPRPRPDGRRAASRKGSKPGAR